MVWRLFIFGLVLVACGGVLAAKEIRSHVPRDLHADIAWDRFDVPLELRSRAYKWYPLTYPILERWSFGDDDVRSSYAMNTITHFGGPLGRLWLHDAIQAPSYYQYVPSAYETEDTARFISATGLDNAASRKTAAQEAIAHLGALPHDAPNESKAFDRDLLLLIGPEALPVLESWAKNAPQDRLTILQSVLPYSDARFTDDDRRREEHLEDLARAADAAIVAESRTPVPRPTADPTSKNAITKAAIIALNNGDRRNLEYLRNVVDGNLSALDADDVVASSNLIAVANAFPASRFARACREYDALRGGSYFGRAYSEDDKIPRATPAQWQAWLTRYPDHPGADDAAYWLGRAEQHAGRRVDAFATYARALERHLGDGDMRFAISDRIRFLLDVGMSTTELATFERKYSASTFAPLARYARAVRHARANDFRGAFALVTARDQARLVRSLPHSLSFYSIIDVQAHVAQQSRRWRTLAARFPNGATTSPLGRDALASLWNDEDGWQIGYLFMYEPEERHGGAPGDGRADLDWPGLRHEARLANQNAQTIALAKTLIGSELPTKIRKRNERRIVVALYQQQAAFPDSETEMMGAPGDVAGDSWKSESETWAHRYIQDFPDDPFCETALLAAYEVTGDTAFLREQIARYPSGDRVEEARAQLWEATKH